MEGNAYRHIRTKLCVIAFATALSLFHDIVLFPDGRLCVRILDVGQGSSALIVTPGGRTVLVDGGPDMRALERLSSSLPLSRRTIDLLVLTHPESDHITAFPEVIKRYRVSSILLTGISHELGRYESLIAEIRAQGVRVLFPDPTHDIDLGDGSVLDVLWPNMQDAMERAPHPNETSIVLRVLSKDHAILLPGDIGERTEAAILASGVPLQSDVIVVPHHGSRTSSSTGFLLAVSPRLAMISSGKENRYGHPHGEVLQRYETLGIPVRRTDAEGTLTIVFP